ncbi:TetR/AcrR family transcriptional regulator [Aquimarina hainanensis]|uniref:TetR/AcrR family transcriptional regulator n=1 Tax=Aquimarina hainanensis TaxID=1578017 RepID=A0ABW5NF10_9FLAO|nr:TetR/AcrR family transcriptional regulator [Aquimarina sp. TRL1]QKX07432.1 TetR/AcrR family transcriptional regulator [Aquimarina sp. TRL1]
MASKADQTKAFIIKKVAPIFNKNGYAATSLSDITKATGLTKGAIYGNFKNKEELAIEAFNMVVKGVLRRITEYQNRSDSPFEKLTLLTKFYRNYYDYIYEYGGCPIINMGVDANNQNTELFAHVQYTIERIQKNLVKIIEQGKKEGEIKPAIDSWLYAKQIYTMIQGAVFMTYTMNDENYLSSIMDKVDQMILNEIKK